MNSHLLLSSYAAVCVCACVAGEPTPSERGTYLAAIEQRFAPDAIARSLRSVGADFDQRWPTLDVIRFFATAEMAERLREHPGFLAVDAVRTARDQARPRAAGVTAATQVVPWGVARVGGPARPTGARLWVFDTGVDPAHPELTVDVEQSKDVVAELGGDREVDYSHGTAVAGVAAARDDDRGVVGVAPGATVVSIRVLDSEGVGRSDDLLAGLDYAASRADPGDVFNLSFAASGRSPVIETAIARVADRGVFVVLAAGNLARDSARQTPAGMDHPGVYTVSAIGDDDCLLDVSNWGPAVDLAAPGRDVLTLRPGGGLTTFDGTSFAAPHVAGLLLSGGVGSDGAVACGDGDRTAEPIAHRPAPR